LIVSFIVNMDVSCFGEASVESFWGGSPFVTWRCCQVQLGSTKCVTDRVSDSTSLASSVYHNCRFVATAGSSFVLFLKGDIPSLAETNEQSLSVQRPLRPQQDCRSFYTQNASFSPLGATHWSESRSSKGLRHHAVEDVLFINGFGNSNIDVRPCPRNPVALTHVLGQIVHGHALLAWEMAHMLPLGRHLERM
jgi:hypothetical protein